MKLFTKKNLLLAAVILGVVGFLGAFLSPLKVELMGISESAGIGDVYFGDPGTILPFLAFFLLLAGAALIFLSTKNGNKKFVLIGIALLVIGGLIPLFTKTLYINACFADIPAGMEQFVEAAKAAAKEMYSLGFGPILGFIGGFGGAACAAVATFVVKD